MIDPQMEFAPDAQALGYSEQVRDAATRSRPRAGRAVGRVIRVDRTSALVLPTGDLDTTVTVRSAPELAVGDWIWLDDTGAVVGSVERANEVTRVRGDGTPQILGTNVDVVLLVVDVERAHRPGLIERLASIGWDSGATPHFVVTKADRATPAHQRDVEDAIFRHAPGVDVTLVSAIRDLGRDPLAATLAHGRTGMMIGHSGVGKSTLLNWLVEDTRAQVGGVRARDAKGRHTTTARTLYVLSSVGGAIIDTPGIRELGISSADALENVFSDIVDLTADCRFRDCRHTGDAGCAVRNAVETGVVDPGRYRRFMAYLKEAEHSGTTPVQCRDKSVEYSRLAREFRRIRGH